MTIVNTETIPGREIYQVLGLVRGSTVRARNVFRDIGAALKNLVGGELRDYTT
ncbi:MAG TPA: heavy metal-binding domain-containing protein, partial [Deltaproteobacteria bacterium]|nr:heavy metal-binding domain-containing protein [Deltaproteobacteria bacterium]